MNWSLLLWYLCFSINIVSCMLSPMISSPLFLWALMEINLISFLILIWSGSNGISKYSVITSYFISQTLASVLLVLFINVVSSNNNFTMFLILSYKTGMVPFHSWFFYISSKVDMLAFFLASTTQKIIPMQFFFMIEAESLVMLFLGFSAIMSSLFIIMLNNNISILIVSSCLMMTWMTTASIFGMSITWTFFMLYMALLGLILTKVNNLNMFSSVGSTSYSEAYSLMMLIIIIMYAGIPPSPVFFMKMAVIEHSLSASFGWISMLLLVSSVISIYAYISLLFNSLQCNSMNWMSVMFDKEDNYVYMLVTSSFIIALSLVLFI